MAFKSFIFITSGHKAWRRHFSVVVGLPIILLAMLFSTLGRISLPYQYPLNQLAKMSEALIVLAPFVALSSAIEMQVIKTVWGQINVRRRWVLVLFSRLCPVVVVGVGSVVLLSVVFVGWDWFANPPGLQYVVVSLAVLSAWIAIGAALGLALSPVFAYPAAILLPYLSLTMPAAVEPLWLRHLTGSLFDCCTSGYVLDQTAVNAALVMQLAIILLAIAIVWVRLGPQRPFWCGVAVLTMAGVAAAAVAASTASGLGAWPIRDRPQEQLICIDGICLWPEDHLSFETNRLAWEDVRSAWQRLNLFDISTTSIGPTSGKNRLGIVSLSPSPEEVATSMVYLLPREVASCGREVEREDVNAAYDRLSRALARQASLVDESQLGGITDVSDLSGDEIELAWKVVNTC